MLRIEKMKNVLFAVGLMVLILLAGCAQVAPGTAKKVELTAGILTELQCTEGNIAGRVTNLAAKQAGVGDIRVLVNGIVTDSVALRCDKTVLQPNDSTYCLSLQGQLPVSGEAEIAVNIGDKQAVETVSCE